MSDQCSVCLEEFDEPVCIPCGHVYCIGCITNVVNRQDNGRAGVLDTAAKCPTCRTEFQLVVPDLTYLPKKYHPFVVPPLRRIYLPAPPASNATQESLSEALKRIDKLERDLIKAKDRLQRTQATEETLMQQCERHQQKARVYREKEMEVRQEMRTMDEVCRGFEVRVRLLEAQLEDRQGHVEELEDKVADLEDKVEGLEEKVDTLEEREEDMHNGRRALKDRIEELEEHVDELEEQNEELEEAKEKLEREVEELEKAEGELTAQREKEVRDDERRKAKKKNAMLEKTAKELGQQNAMLGSRCLDLEADLKHLRSENKKLREAARPATSEAAFSSSARVVKALPKRRRTAGDDILGLLNPAVPRNFLVPAPVMKRARLSDVV